MQQHIAPDVAVDKLVGRAVKKAMREAGVSDLAKVAYSVPEVVKASSLSKATVYKAIRLGSLRSYRIGARRIIRPADLVRWLEGQPPTSD